MKLSLYSVGEKQVQCMHRKAKQKRVFFMEGVTPLKLLGILRDMATGSIGMYIFHDHMKKQIKTR